MNERINDITTEELRQAGIRSKIEELLPRVLTRDYPDDSEREFLESESIAGLTNRQLIEIAAGEFNNGNIPIRVQDGDEDLHRYDPNLIPTKSEYIASFADIIIDRDSDKPISDSCYVIGSLIFENLETTPLSESSDTNRRRAAAELMFAFANLGRHIVLIQQS